MGKIRALHCGIGASEAAREICENSASAGDVALESLEKFWEIQASYEEVTYGS